MFLKESSLILRLDPKNIFPFVLDEEVNSEDRTVFKIRPLTIMQYTICKDSIGSRTEKLTVSRHYYNVVRNGLIGWDNFKYNDNNEPIPFSKDNINALPLAAIDELSQAIFTLSEIDEETTNNVRLAVRWSEYLGKHKNPDDWNCVVCQDNGLHKGRNCHGTDLNTCRFCKKEVPEAVCPTCNKLTSPRFIVKFGNVRTKNAIYGLDYVTQCPVALMDSRVISVMNAVNFTDDSKSLPVAGEALEQSHYYYALRGIMLGERNQLMKANTEQATHQTPQQSSPQNVRHVNLGKRH